MIYEEFIVCSTGSILVKSTYPDFKKIYDSLAFVVSWKDNQSIGIGLVDQANSSTNLFK